MKNTMLSNIMIKASNQIPIRVLYKKVGRNPEIKIVSNVAILKRAIIKNNLSIVPYEHLFIIYNPIKNFSNTDFNNIALPFYKITGDLILVDIDKKTREFESLSQEDLIWYSSDLANKSFNYSDTVTKQISKQFNSLGLQEKNSKDSTCLISTDFEKKLLNALLKIDKTLNKTLKKEKKQNN